MTSSPLPTSGRFGTHCFPSITLDAPQVLSWLFSFNPSHKCQCLSWCCFLLSSPLLYTPTLMIYSTLELGVESSRIGTGESFWGWGWGGKAWENFKGMVSTVGKSFCGNSVLSTTHLYMLMIVLSANLSAELGISCLVFHQRFVFGCFIRTLCKCPR